AEEGIVADIALDEVPRLVRRGDLVLCRTTAPLVELCIALIRHRVPARVAGREIGSGLAQLVHEVTRLEGYSWQHFGHFLDRYRHEQSAKLRQFEGAERELERIRDRVEAVGTCFVLFQAHDAEDLCRKIDELFRDAGPAVTLSTVHRAKGLEADRV